MIKKKFLKKLVVAASLVMMMASLAACGKEEKEQTTTQEEKTTTEEKTEEEDNLSETDTDENVEDSDKEDTSEEETVDISTDDSFYVADENGNYTMYDVSFCVPEDLSIHEEADPSITFSNADNSLALVVSVDNNNSYFTDENVAQEFDSQIKLYYGDDITWSKVTYGTYDAYEWVLDNEEMGYVGRSLVVCDGNIVIYVEYVSYNGDINDYEALVNSIVY